MRAWLADVSSDDLAVLDLALLERARLLTHVEPLHRDLIAERGRRSAINGPVGRMVLGRRRRPWDDKKG